MKIKKVDDRKFRIAVTLLLMSEGAIEINETMRSDNYRIVGANNAAEFFIDDNVGSEVYSVFCRFDKCNELSGDMNSKHNFHRAGEVGNMIGSFDLFLHEVIQHLD